MNIITGTGTTVIKNTKSLYNVLDMCFGNPNGIITSMQNTRQFCTQNSKGKIVAVLSVKDQGKDHDGITHTNMIYNVCTLPTFRKRGIMSKMLSYMINFYKKEKKRVLHLEVRYNNNDAIRLYKKFGFKIINKTNLGYLMKCKLLDPSNTTSY